MNQDSPSFARYAAQRMHQDREQITRDWIDRLSQQVCLAPERVLPHERLLDDIPAVLGKAAEFPLVPEPEKLTRR